MDNPRDLHAFPTRRSSDLAVNELLDRGGDAGDVVVNLHAQLNMLGGLMAMLIGATFGVLLALGGAPRPRAVRVALREQDAERRPDEHRDRKSTRLNSSHAN